MQKEDITLIAQLLTGMKDAIEKLEHAQKKNDLEGINLAKKTILSFQSQLDSLL